MKCYQIVVVAGSRLERHWTSGPDVSALPLQLPDHRDQLVAALGQLQEIQVQAVRLVGHLYGKREARYSRVERST